MDRERAHDPYRLGELLPRALEGDRAALNDLLEQVRPYLHWAVRRETIPGILRRDGDSDVVQETLLRIHYGLARHGEDDQARFKGREVPQFLAWARRIVKNYLKDRAKWDHCGKRDVGREVAGDDIFPRLGKEADDPPDRDPAREAAALGQALLRLPAHYREVLRLRFFDQLSYAEIGERLNKSEGALRVLCLRAVERLEEDPQLRREMEASS
jgi:RNA polymerase sigma-70 factor, ECF subfamily